MPERGTGQSFMSTAVQSVRKPMPRVGALVEKMRAAEAAGKAAYAERDRLAKRIARLASASQRTVTMLPGAGVKVINNRRKLREKGVLYGIGGVRMWDIEPMTQAELALFED